MNILLVNVPVPDVFKIFEYCDDEGKHAITKRVLVGPPLALNELAGTIRDENVYILDEQAELNADSDYDFVEQMLKAVVNFEPQIIGFTCLTAQYNNVIKAIEAVKKHKKNILCVVGGVHPSSAPEDFVNSKVDIISIGLGKYSFRCIVQEFKKDGFNADFMKIPSIAVHKGNGLAYSKSFCDVSYKDFVDKYFMSDTLPNRELTDRYPYLIPNVNRRIHYLCTSQGCTNKCNFCCLWKMTNGFYLHKDTETILKEIATMDNYDVIRFADANTFGDIKRAKELFTRIIEEGFNKKHVFMADVRVDTVTRHPEIIELAVKAGLRIVVCGLEATSDEELKKYGKDIGVSEITDGLNIMNELGIKVNGNYIIRPDYDLKDFENVGRFMEDHPIYNSAMTILTPFPGTQQWNELQDQIVIRNYDYYNLTNCVLKTKLPIDVFYGEIAKLYKVNEKSGEVFKQKYGRND